MLIDCAYFALVLESSGDWRTGEYPVSVSDPMLLTFLVVWLQALAVSAPWSLERNFSNKNRVYVNPLTVNVTRTFFLGSLTTSSKL